MDLGRVKGVLELSQLLDEGFGHRKGGQSVEKRVEIVPRCGSYDPAEFKGVAADVGDSGRIGVAGSAESALADGELCLFNRHRSEERLLPCGFRVSLNALRRGEAVRRGFLPGDDRC